MSEAALLKATRDHLIARCGLREDQCTVEFDEMLPAVAGHPYNVLVIPSSATEGPTNARSGGVLDGIYSLSVAVVWKIGNVPRDRQRDVFLYRTENMSKAIREIIDAIHFDYELTNRANAEINERGGSFVVPLRWVGIDVPRVVDGSMFDGRGDQVAIARRVNFGGARCVQYLRQEAE